MGKYMAKRFVSEGANVVITGRRADVLEEAKREIAAPDGGRVLTVPMDVRNPDQVAEMVGRADAEFGRIDALVNNAAGNFICPAEKLSINGWNSVINIVLNGTFYCSREVGNYWIQRGLKGNILNIIATYAWHAGAGVIHSASAKAGVLAMTRTLAVEWGKSTASASMRSLPGRLSGSAGRSGFGNQRKQSG